jgi:hypothetical protein
LIELGEGQRSLQAEASSFLLTRDSDGGLEGLFGCSRICGVALQRDFAAEAMNEGKIAPLFNLMGQGQRIIDA